MATGNDHQLNPQKARNRLRRAAGQLGGIEKMMDEGQDCTAIVTQLTAVRSSIDRLIGLVVADNLERCLLDEDVDADTRAAKVAQAINLIVKK